MAETKRRYDRNRGLIAAKHLPDDKFFVGAVVVMMDDAGEYSTEFLPISMDEVPGPEVQETLGGMLGTAFEIANLTRGTS